MTAPIHSPGRADSETRFDRRFEIDDEYITEKGDIKTLPPEDHDAQLGATHPADKTQFPSAQQNNGDAAPEKRAPSSFLDKLKKLCSCNRKV